MTRSMTAGRAAALALSFLALAGARAAADDGGAYGPGWSAVHADAANTDYHQGDGPGELKLAWSRSFGGMINLGPTADAAGRIYFTSSGSGCRLHALDGATGKTLWCSDVVDKLAVASSPLLDRDGNLFVADGKAMRSFSPAGELRWTTPIIGVPLSAQFTPHGDVVVITNVGVIYILDRQSGRAVMEPHALVPNPRFDPSKGAMACMRGLPECPSANTPAVDMATGRIFFTFWAPGAPRAGIRAMRITGGASPTLVEEWVNESLPGGSAASPDISADGKRLYLTDNEGGLHALDAATGNILWSYPIGYASGGSVSTSPEGLIIPAGGTKAALMALRDAGDHAETVWRKADVNNFGVATQAGGFKAYPTASLGHGRAELLTIDTRTGEILDRDAIPGKPIFTVGTTLGPDGTVYVATILGEMHAYAGRGEKPRAALRPAETMVRPKQFHSPTLELATTKRMK